MFKFEHYFELQSTQAQNLYRFFLLRNALIAGALLLVYYVTPSNHTYPIFYITVILICFLAFNLFTGWWLFSKKIITNRTLLWQLAIDIVAFTGVLYFTGGASNPFGWFYLVPIFIAATLLPGRAAWLITALSMLGYTVLMFFYHPIENASPHSMHMQHNSGFQQHILGMWLGYMVTAILVAYVVARMANSLREQDRHLALAREKSLRDERLVALGTLAAGTAHELGTPLSTIAILVKEIQNTSSDKQSTEYLTIIREQLDRCKTALRNLSHSAGEELMQGGQLLPVSQYLEEVIEQWQQQRPATKLILESNLKHIEANILAEQTITQALINILNNAADASPENIHLQVTQLDKEITIHVRDNGSGLNSMMQNHAGKQTYSNKDQGLGLGLFLAYASIERLGGTIFLSNHEQGGAIVKISLPLTQENCENTHD
jgi:two-component system, sensor histidine kinase RegB